MSDDKDAKPRGRPRVDDPRDSPLSVWLRKSEHDQIVRLALKHDVTVSKMVRALLLKPR